MKDIDCQNQVVKLRSLNEARGMGKDDTQEDVQQEEGDIRQDVGPALSKENIMIGD